MAATITAQCPGTVCTCGGAETVTATRGHDRRTGRATITFAPCASLKAQGWTGRVASVEWDDAPATETVWQHRDGLVTFAGAR